jgi:RHS repeat-associated protein
VSSEINTIPDKLARPLAVTPYLFSGQQGVVTDPNGLLYMRARYYHPGLRRFVNPDPIGFEGGSNWYGYAGGNPLMANDPTGLAVRNAGRAVGNAIVGAAKSGLDYLIGRNAGAAWGRVLTDFGGWKEDAQRRIGRLLDGVFEETGIDPAINDNKFGHAAQAQDSQKEFGLIGTPLVTIGGLLYELFHILAPGHPQNGHSTGWGGPSPFFGTFDGQFPSNWLYDTPGDLLGNTLGQLGGILNMNSGSWNKGGYLIPGPNYSNGASYLSPVWPGAANPFR